MIRNRDWVRITGDRKGRPYGEDGQGAVGDAGPYGRETCVHAVGEGLVPTPIREF